MPRLFLVVAAAALVAAEPTPPVTRVVGHRGLARHAPENTLANIDACLDLRLDIEFDVRRTRDGQLVVIHDATVGRTTSGKGKVADLSLRDLQAFDAGGWFDPAFAGERVPTLDAVFARVAVRKAAQTLLAVDLKDPAIEADVVRLAVKHGVLRQLVFIGLAIEDRAVREALKAADAGAVAAVLCPAADKLDATIADPTAGWVYVRFVPTAGEVARAHAAGKKVFLVGPLVAGYEISGWSAGRAAGVDAILTDYPLECRAARVKR
ncbi:MAG TPA: glycerophosphodiester phosphodiesterase family protein [Urbifossiella sp.]|jgi:glycerophosphoryl diester phosphodiesterase|nr:glycerophosphodiester phosphodiesterase family protein [Urbifossiella sp.]